MKSSLLKNIRKIIAVLLIICIIVLIHYTFFRKIPTYTITLDTGNELKTYKVKKGEKFSLPFIPTKEGYEFVEWQVNGRKFTFDKEIDSNVTVTAVWRRVSKDSKFYIVSFDTDGGNNIGSINVEANTVVLKPKNPIKEDKDGIKYTFLYWEYEEKEYNFETPVTKDITLIAKYQEEKEEFTVSFDTQGGSSISPQKVKAGERATRPSNPSKDGQTFVEWRLNNRTYNFNTIVTNNITLTAIWQEVSKTQEQVTITFNSNGGSPVNSLTINKGSKVSRPADPTRSGYTFAGWELQNGNAFDFNTPVNNNITLNAKWNEIIKNNYTISYDSDGGSQVNTQTVIEGNKATKPADPTKIGYNFGGWKLNGNAFDFNTPIKSNIILVANWNQKVFTIKAVAHDQFSNNRSLEVYADGVKIDFTAVYYSSDGYLVVESGRNNVDQSALDGENEFLVQLPGSNEKFKATIVS